MSEDIKILIIDDDEVDRLSVQRSIRMANMQATIATADRGSKGLELLHQNKYDCIFIDFRLPDTDGVELLRTIRKEGISTPILIVTSHGDERIATDALRSGASDYISKNLLTPEGISQSIRNAIRVYEVEQERQATEKALRESRERLNEAQKLAKLGNWELNFITKKVTWSDEIFNILELPFGPELSPEEYYTFIHPDDREHRESVIKNAIKGKCQYQQDYRIILKNGKLKHVNVYGSPIINEQNEVIALLGTMQDISDLMSARNALKVSESRYRMLIETMNDGVLHVDNEQTILFANRRFCEMLGYDKTEVIGKPLYLFIPDEEARYLLDTKNTLRQQQISDHYELELKKKNGDKVCFLIGGSPLTNQTGEVIGSMGTLTDITERKKIEEALSSSEKLFRTLFENTQGFICTHALDGTILSINKAGAGIIGREPGSLVNRNIRELLEEQDQQIFDAYLTEIQAGKQASGILPFVQQQTGNKCYLLYRNILYTEPGKAAYVIASAQDITERIAIEQELLQAKMVAEKSVKVKEQFLANISHEIRTPMNGIIGLTGVLQKMVEDEEQKSFLQAIQSSADKLLVIINDILDFSKIDAGKIEFEQVYFNPKTLLCESINLFEAKAAQKNNKLKAIIDADVPDTVVGDPGKLAQVFNNLIDNAVKFTQDGQIKIFAEVVAEDPETVMLEFTVQDNGIGIPEEKLNAVFESFTQASSDTTRKYGGTGLGLTISKQFIELQGGNIKVQSELNLGTNFTFRLCFRKQLDEPVAKPAIPATIMVQPAELGRLRLLLAEDNQINQLLVKKIIADWGYELDIAENGLEALELFNQHDYDLILMDMQMPEMDGYEATEYIRQSKNTKSQTPVIALTAHATQGEVDKCLEAGADAYMSKPFKPELLLQEIAKLVRRNPAFEAPEAGTDALLPETKSAKKAAINLDYLREMAGGDISFMEEIITMFIQQTPENIDKLSSLAASQSWLDVKALAHKMKSSVVLVGVQELVDIFTNLQKYAVSPIHTELIPAMVERAREICEAAIEELKIELKTLDKTA